MENHSHANTHTDTRTDDKSTKIVRLLGLIGGVNRAYYLLRFKRSTASYCRRNPQASSLNYKAMPVVAGVAVLMGIWWMTEAIDLPVTSAFTFSAF